MHRGLPRPDDLVRCCMVTIFSIRPTPYSPNHRLFLVPNRFGVQSAAQPSAAQGTAPLRWFKPGPGTGNSLWFFQRQPSEVTRPAPPQNDHLVGRGPSPGVPVWSIMRIAATKGRRPLPSGMNGRQLQQRDSSRSRSGPLPAQELINLRPTGRVPRDQWSKAWDGNFRLETGSGTNRRPRPNRG